MAIERDILSILSTEVDKAVDQIIKDAKRLNIVVNGNSTATATVEDGSVIPSLRKALLENLYFKTPPLPWRAGTSVSVFNQLYVFSDVNTGSVTWWYAPSATTTAPVVMQAEPYNDTRFRVFLDKTTISELYAPIESPVFKGNPRGPTPPEGDASESFANTKWVSDKVTPLQEALDEIQAGEFENIKVAESATTKNLVVSGAARFDGTIEGITPSRIGALSKENNLSDVDDKMASRKNLAVDYQVSTSPAPSSSSGYEEGFIWYQVEA